VGCVIVAKGGTEIGYGYHEKFGEAHAERVALANVKTRGNSAHLPGATIYVTLEPCCHHGKTPPCTDALIKAQPERVVVAMLDPFDAVCGKGCERLRQAGISVDVGCEEQQARRLNAPYLKRITTGLPWVIAKWAMSMDGKIATRTQHSQWISCSESRAFVHQLRSRVDAIVVGRNTALHDDPLLTARNSGTIARRALRVVADSLLQLPITSQLVQSARQHETLVLAGPDAACARVEALERLGVQVLVSEHADPGLRVEELLRYIACEKQGTNVLVEGGSKLLGSLADRRLIDQCEVFIAPKLIGGIDAAGAIAGLGVAKVDDGIAFQIIATERRGTDLHISCTRSD